MTNIRPGQPPVQTTQTEQVDTAKLDQTAGNKGGVADDPALLNQDTFETGGAGNPDPAKAMAQRLNSGKTLNFDKMPQAEALQALATLSKLPPELLDKAKVESGGKVMSGSDLLKLYAPQTPANAPVADAAAAPADTPDDDIPPDLT